MRPASTAGPYCLAAVTIAVALGLGGCSGSADRPREPVDAAATEAELQLIAGIKEAMVVAIGRAVDRLGREDGYLKDQRVRVPLPDDVQGVAPLLRNAGLGHLVDDLDVAVNRAAEKAAVEAAPILLAAARNMPVANASKLLAEHDAAITEYFRQRTGNDVESAYRPVIQRHLEAEPGYRQWVGEIPEQRRQFPYLNPLVIDEVPYVTDAALDGLFTAIGDEEQAIRTRSEMRTTDLLQAVFGGR